ncbi:MAG: DNA primase [Candidatus Levybacteria bacterium]|nr:DNA primase [Candidatus Levybacteria bacterium]
MDQLSQVREKIDIVSLISEFIPLKKFGRNFSTVCPFHKEKSPSFVVSPERQIWHCFGCNRGGDCFSFLMQYENIEFPEALRMLAKRAGVELKRFKYDDGIASQKEKIYTINRQALEFYHYVLTKHPVGVKALSYLLEERKINDAVLKTFMLGFAPSSGNALVNYLISKKGYAKEELVNAGLATQKGRMVVDFFAHRILFPLFDHRDNVVGFSGRVMDNSSLAKYVNTRETLVYHKGSVFFGLNIAKNEIKKDNRAIIMEGELDVISSFQTGVANVVAVKGTALTENQVSLISRFAKEVSLCFDQDNAGQEAIKRSLPILEKNGLTTTIIVIPNGKDPDESVKENPGVFKKAVKEAVGAYDFLISKALSLFDKKTAEGKKKISDELLPFIANIENEIVKEHYLKKLANELDTSFESINKQVDRIIKKISDKPIILQTKEKRLREEVLEEYLVALLLQGSDVKDVIKKVSKILSGFSLSVSSLQRIFNDLSVFLDQYEFDRQKFEKTLPTELLSSYDVCYLLPLPVFSQDKYKNEVERVANELKVLYLKNKIRQIGEKIKTKEKNQADISDEDVELKELEKEFSVLVSKLAPNQ